MNDIHSAHGTTCIVEHPFFVQIDMLGRDLIQVVDNILDDGRGIIAMGLERPERELMQLIGLKDVKGIKV